MTIEVNREYYEASSPAREDYWRYMAAPRARVATILEAVRSIGPSSVVDLGCGNGALLKEVADRLPGLRLAGFDLSSRQIEENRKLLPSVEWSVADLGEPVTAPAEPFDAVIASEVVEHLEQPESLLSNARILAGTDGHLVITTQSGPVRETERRVGHVRHFSAGDLTRLLESTGWTPLRVWNEGWPFHDLSKWWANRDPDASMARFGSGEGYGWKEKAICAALRGAFRFNSRQRGAQLYALARRRS